MWQHTLFASGLFSEQDLFLDVGWCCWCAFFNLCHPSSKCQDGGSEAPCAVQSGCGIDMFGHRRASGFVAHGPWKKFLDFRDGSAWTKLRMVSAWRIPILSKVQWIFIQLHPQSRNRNQGSCPVWCHILEWRCCHVVSCRHRRCFQLCHLQWKACALHAIYTSHSSEFRSAAGKTLLDPLAGQGNLPQIDCCHWPIGFLVLIATVGSSTNFASNIKLWKASEKSCLSDAAIVRHF